MAKQENRTGAGEKTDLSKAAAVFTKEQLVRSETLGLPRDAVIAVLRDGETYTKDQAHGLVKEFFERKV